MLPEDLELQVKHFQGSLSGPVCILFESMAKKLTQSEARIKELETSVLHMGRAINRKTSTDMADESDNIRAALPGPSKAAKK